MTREAIQIPDGVRMENRFLQQLISSWMGLAGGGGAADLAGIPLRQTSVSDDALYAGAFRNRGAGGLHMRVLSSDGLTTLFSVTDAGVFASSAGATATQPFALVGMILAWHGTAGSIPAQWQICDGTNGTPDLRDRFIVGAGTTYALNATGGATTHQHTATTSSDGTGVTGSGGTGNTGDSASGEGGQPSSVRSVTDTGSDQETVASDTHRHTGASHNHSGPDHQHTGPSHNHTLTTAAGSSLPPYYALYYIKRVAA